MLLLSVYFGLFAISLLSADCETGKKMHGYRIYSINRPGRLLNFCTLRVGAYSRWALIRGWALIKFSTLQQVQYVYFATKQ